MEGRAKGGATEGAKSEVGGKEGAGLERSQSRMKLGALKSTHGRQRGNLIR